MGWQARLRASSSRRWTAENTARTVSALGLLMVILSSFLVGRSRRAPGRFGTAPSWAGLRHIPGLASAAAAVPLPPGCKM